MATSEHVYTVTAQWDDEAGVWVATGKDVPGLVTEAITVEALIEKLRVMVPEMLEANGVLPAGSPRDVPFKVIAERVEQVRAA